MRRWFVVHTQPRAEERALWHLRNQGFHCFLPRLRKLRRHARRVQLTLEPLFPRYLFANFDPSATAWRSINGTRGVIGVLINGCTPQAVPHGVVEVLQREAYSDGATPLTTLGLLREGRKVRIASGAFAGQTGEVAGISSKGSDRVQILLDLLGVKARLPVPSYAIDVL
jgi:transcriptional antiterminator RfaH